MSGRLNGENPTDWRERSRRVEETRLEGKLVAARGGRGGEGSHAAAGDAVIIYLNGPSPDMAVKPSAVSTVNKASFNHAAVSPLLRVNTYHVRAPPLTHVISCDSTAVVLYLFRVRDPLKNMIKYSGK